MSRVRPIVRGTAHALAAVAAILCVLLPTSRYDWVSGVDPATRPGDLAGGTDDSALVVGAIAALALAIEAIAVAVARNRGERIVPMALMTVVAAAWLVR